MPLLQESFSWGSGMTHSIWTCVLFMQTMKMNFHHSKQYIRICFVDSLSTIALLLGKAAIAPAMVPAAVADKK